MLQDHIRQLEEKLDTQVQRFPSDPNTFSLKIDPELEIAFRNLEEGIFLEAKLGQVPKKNREDIFVKLSEMNLLGQGGLGSIFGMTEDSKFLTMSHFIDYDISFLQFYEILEDFVNLAKITQEEMALTP